LLLRLPHVDDLDPFFRAGDPVEERSVRGRPAEIEAHLLDHLVVLVERGALEVHHDCYGHRNLLERDVRGVVLDDLRRWAGFGSAQGRSDYPTTVARPPTGADTSAQMPWARVTSARNGSSWTRSACHASASTLGASAIVSARSRTAIRGSRRGADSSGTIATPTPAATSACTVASPSARTTTRGSAPAERSCSSTRIRPRVRSAPTNGVPASSASESGRRGRPPGASST